MESVDTWRPSVPYTDRVYVHQLNLTSGDILRKRREKEAMEEDRRKMREIQEIKRRQREEEKKRDMQMLLSYNPWGKPGGGAPKDEVKRTKFEEAPLTELPPQPIENEDSVELFIRKFGRPGAGAPNRTASGRVKAQIVGDPDIRFQDTQHVRLSIENHLRYKNQDKENYSRNLDEIIQQKQSLQEKEKEWDKQKLEEMREMYPFGRRLDNEPLFMPTRPRRRALMKEDFDPWGKGFGNPDRDQRGNVHRHKFSPSSKEGVKEPIQDGPPEFPFGRIRGGGAGAPILTESGHPRTRLPNTLHNIKAVEQEMEEKRKRQEQERMMDKEGGVELASVIRQGVGGRPKKDPTTGELVKNPIRRTDVTTQVLDIRRVKSQESLQYHDELSQQAAERQRQRERQKEVERAQSQQHLHTWESFWGRPGHGAPRDPKNHRKENLESLLTKAEEAGQPYVRHYVAEVVPSKHVNRYEYPTRDTQVIKKEYEFKTPYPAMEA